MEPREHPAKFSKPVLDELRRLLRVEADRLGERRLHVLDPFAGSGKIHELLDEHDTVGIELEEEWACAHPRTVVGDATKLPGHWTGTFHVVATSPVYPNRMTDTYDGKGKCRKCGGSREMNVVDNVVAPCDRCDGTGIDQSKRYTYRIYLDREPSENSACVMKWGPEYRELHHDALVNMIGAVVEDGAVMINMSNSHATIGSGSRRREVEHEVVEWWITQGISLGCRVHAVIPVETQRMGNGANRDKRTDSEKIIVFRTPRERRLL